VLAEPRTVASRSCSFSPIDDAMDGEEHAELDEVETPPAQRLIAVYKTGEAAKKAKQLLTQDGIPDERISVLAPDQLRGTHLAVFAGHAAASVAWLGAALGAGTGGLLLGLAGRGSLSVWIVGDVDASRWVAAAVGAAAAGLLGAATGAFVGWRRLVLRAGFFAADADKGGTALGVLAQTAEEVAAASSSFRATGAQRVWLGVGKRRL
jgi:hypothetical protein